MAESEARRRSREAKEAAGAASTQSKDKPPLQITLLGYEIVLDVLDLTIDEKMTWRRYANDLGVNADEVDMHVALAVVLIQRQDPEFTWDEAKKRIKWRTMMDAISAGRPAEIDHPQ